MLTAKSDTVDVVVGLESGADDYVVKPFKPKELVARIRARVRRFDAHRPRGADHRRPGIDVAGHAVTRDATQINLTPLEFDLLVCLARKPWQVFTREVLLEQVWGYRHAADTRLVNVHVQRLRSKVEHDPENPEIVVTVRGVGYKAGVVLRPSSMASSTLRAAVRRAHLLAPLDPGARGRQHRGAVGRRGERGRLVPAPADRARACSSTASTPCRRGQQRMADANGGSRAPRHDNNAEAQLHALVEPDHRARGARGVQRGAGRPGRLTAKPFDEGGSRTTPGSTRGASPLTLPERLRRGSRPGLDLHGPPTPRVPPTTGPASWSAPRSGSRPTATSTPSTSCSRSTRSGSRWRW